QTVPGGGKISPQAGPNSRQSGSVVVSSEAPSAIPLRNSLADAPRERASSGSLRAPNRMSTTSRTMTSSPAPILPIEETSFAGHVTPKDVRTTRRGSRRPRGSAQGHRIHELLETLPGDEPNAGIPAFGLVDHERGVLFRHEHRPVGLGLLEGDDEPPDRRHLHLRVVAGTVRVGHPEGRCAAFGGRVLAFSQA